MRDPVTEYLRECLRRRIAEMPFIEKPKLFTAECPVDGAEYGWLIEATNPLGKTMWWTGREVGQIAWTHDALGALRFAREGDALALIETWPAQKWPWVARAAEHGFADIPRVERPPDPPEISEIREWVERWKQGYHIENRMDIAAHRATLLAAYDAQARELAELRATVDRLPFRILLDWFMASDPWPLEEGHGVIESWLNREAGVRGWVDWTQAYHEEPPGVLGEETP